ncbi:MAG: hypothetical protein R3E40_09310 [Rhodocyclaceae bacterium]
MNGATGRMTGVVDGASLERRHRNDEIGTLQRRRSLGRIGAVEFGFGVQDEIGLARFGQHARGVGALRTRHGIGDVAADRVGSLVPR